jgi:uncharacterized delta-60 repeat protein
MPVRPHAVTRNPRPTRRPVKPSDALHTAVAETLEPRRLFAAGDLDSTFGTGGVTKVHTTGSQSDYGYSVAVQTDGKIVVAGVTGDGSNTNNDFLVTRFNTNGTLDPTFGTGGKVITDFGNTEDVTSVAIQSDGKILVGGGTGSGAGQNWAIARYNTDGTLDTTFGAAGKVTLDFNGFGDDVYSLAIQPLDGKIVATGSALAATSDLATVRFNTNGSLDTTFGAGGKVVTDYFGGVDGPGDVELQSDGKIVIVGGSVPAGSYRRWVLVRYNANGTPDATFGASGKATTDFGSSSYAKDLAIQPADGKLVVGGLVGGSGSTQNFAVARYNTNGTLDSTFGSAGSTVVTGFTGFTFSTYGTSLQTDGKILFGGYLQDASSNSYFGLVRFNADGTLDSTFGAGGKVQTDVPGAASGFSQGADVALQSDGKILMAGSVYSGANGYDLVATRYLATGSAPPSPFVLDGSGKLTITGTALDDVLILSSSAGVFSATLNGTTQTFTASDVHSLAVSLLAGNDSETHNGGVPGGTSDLGDGNDFLTLNTGNLISTSLTVTAGIGNDSLTLGVAAFTPVVFDGGAGTDSITFNGSQGNDTLNISSTSVTGGGNSLTYSNSEVLDVEGNFGFDIINATFVSIPLIINAGDGDDTVTVGSGNLDSMGAVTVNGQNGADSLVINDSTATYNDNYTLTSTTIARPFSSTFTFGTVESFRLRAETGPNVITVSSVPSTMSLQIDGDGGGDTLTLNAAATAPVVFNAGAGASTLNVNAGTYAFNADAQLTSPTLTVNVPAAGAVTFNTTQHLAALNLTGGTATLPANGARVLVTSSLVIAGTGKLDLNDNSLIIDYSFNSPLATTRTYLSNARNDGAWTGTTGITSTTAKNDATKTKAIGYIEASDLGVSSWNGQAVDSTALLFKLTRYGDANLDSNLNADDFALTDRGFAKHLTGYTNGDFNASGSVTAADYLLLDQSYRAQGNPFSPDFLTQRESQFGPDYVSQLLTTIPEPSTLFPLVTGYSLLTTLPFPRRKRPPLA